MIIKCVFLLNIECDSISDGNRARGLKYCFIRNILADNTTNISFNGGLYSNLKTELIFDNCKLYTIPLQLFNTYPKLRIIYGFYIYLENITKENFRFAYHLEILDLSKNNIRKLENLTFSWTYNLEYIDLSGNQIEEIQTLAFYGAHELKHLYLQNNKINEIKNGTFHNTLKLKTLKLNNNNLKFIQTKLFLFNINLLDIYLNNNEINEIDINIVRYIKNINQFKISNNSIENFNYIIVNGISIDVRHTNAMGCYCGERTQIMKASNNQISFILIDKNSTNLIELNLSHNKLINIYNLTNLNELKLLDLSFNQINDINLNTFKKMSKLEYLNLKNSGLKQITFGLFTNKLNLQLLDLSNNNLNTIELNWFASMRTLNELFIDGNNLTEIDFNKIRQFFPNLIRISISNNNWNCMSLSNAINDLENAKIEIVLKNNDDLIKNDTNVHGIPCQIISNDTLKLNKLYIQNVFNDDGIVSVLNNDNKKKIASTIDKNYQFNEKCRITLMNSNDMDLIIKLTEIKYKIITFYNEFKTIINNIEFILDDISKN